MLKTLIVIVLAVLILCWAIPKVGKALRKAKDE